MLLKYVDGKKNEMEFCNKGEGGLEEMKTYLEDDQIRFGIIQTVVEGLVL